MNEPYILVLYYSRTDSVAQLAQLVARGVDQVPGICARVRTVPSVSATCEASEESVPKSGPPYATLDDLKHCAGILVGSPTRFGNMAAPLKYFLDKTGGLWQSGALVDKPVSAFTSTSSMHGGQETTLITMMIPFIHHGAVVAGVPFTEPALFSTQTGGTPYGASHVAGNDNNLPISDDEQTVAIAQGKRLATIALALQK